METQTKIDAVKTERTGPVLFSEYKRGEGIKKALKEKREDILFEIKDSNLKGRGGAGFPTSTKWMLTAAAKADKKFIVCNADEGEPGTFKDRVLLMEYPELVFEGMVIGGYTIGAKDGIVYLRGEYEYMLEQLEDYLANMRKDNLLGEKILGTEFSFDISIRLGSGAYVCGEETALIESLEGNRGEPRNRPPYPVNTGYMGYPTSVNNVETLAAVPHIVTKGGDWFKNSEQINQQVQNYFQFPVIVKNRVFMNFHGELQLMNCLKLLVQKIQKLFRLAVLQVHVFQSPI